MRHADGVACDLFITHAWIEGVFELIDKVINSWPSGCRGAYICTLSNPQNDSEMIADLIANPQTSPFAQALKLATYVLVVPNRSTSIYTRLWCVYEAYLAYLDEKTILTASPPSLANSLDRLRYPALSLLAGLFL